MGKKIHHGELVLGIAAQSFDNPSVTFIRDHARFLAEGRTVQFSLTPSLSSEDRDNRWTFKNSSYEYRSILVRIQQNLISLWIRYFDKIAHGWLEPCLLWPIRAQDLSDLSEFIRTKNVNIILAEYGPVGYQLLNICKRLGLPLFVHFHGWDAHVLGNSKLVRRRYKQLFRGAAGIIVTTDFLKDRVLAIGCPSKKILVCPCGIDTDMFKPVPQDGVPRVLMVSRLIPWKGPDLSIESFAKATADLPNARLEIIGDGPLLNGLIKKVKGLGISDKVIFYGAQSHDFVRSRMQACQLFIQHCITIRGESLESQGLSVLEAMSCERPVVVTRHGSLEEIVEHERTGILIAERDVNAMAVAIRDLLNNRQKSVQLGREGRRTVLNRFEIKKCTERLQSFIGI